MLNKFFVLIYLTFFAFLKAEEDLVLMPLIESKEEEILIKKGEDRFINIYLDDITDNYFLFDDKVVNDTKEEVVKISQDIKEEVESANDDYNFALKIDGGFGYQFFQLNNYNTINSFESKDKMINGSFAFEFKYKKVGLEYDFWFLKGIENENNSLKISSNSQTTDFNFFNNYHNLRFKIFFLETSFLTADINFGSYIANLNYTLNYSSKIASSGLSGINQLILKDENLKLNTSLIGAQIGTGWLFKFSQYYNAYFDIRYILPIKSFAGMEIYSINQSSFDSFILKIAFENHIFLTKGFILNLAIKYHMERFKFINSSNEKNFTMNNSLIMFNVGLIFRI